ncbi:TPA: hypothetical protein ACIZCU_002116, partial [Legionella pneumophila]|nr:hypothetical protein [Legionella pneumophila subsp. pneumophila]HAU0162759.1 hypothetical protein [Legionella pneumophila]
MQTNFELNGEKAQLLSMVLAKLVLSSYNGKLNFKFPHSKNLETEEENLAYWLNYKSFLKYKIQQLASKYQITDADNFPENLKTEVRQLLDKYFELKEMKKELPKLILDDYEVTNYLELRSKKEKTMSFTVTPELTRALLKGLNRIRKAIGNRIVLEEITTKEYAPQGTVYKLARRIKDLKPGERKQFVYYHTNKQHAVAFDVENRGGTLKIFCFDSSKDETQLEAIDLLIDKLQKDKVKFEIKACQAGIQKDETNCSIFSILALKEFAKYDHVFDYLPEKCEEDEHLKKQSKATVSTGLSKDREVTLHNMYKVGWIKIKDMPTRIISMDQSYTEMESILRVSNQFDLDAKKFSQAHKDYMDISEDSENNKKLVNVKRKLLDQRSKSVLSEAETKLFEKHLESIPALSFMKEKQDLNIKEILQNEKTIEEKLELIRTVFLAIVDIYKIAPYNNLTNHSMPDHVARALLNLRNEFLILVCRSDEEVKQKYLFTRPKKPPLNFKADSILDKPGFERGNIHKAFDILLSNLNDKMERRKFFKRFASDELEMPSLVLGDSIEESKVREQIERLENEFGYDKNAKDDAFDQAEFMLKKISGYSSRNCFELINYKTPMTPIFIAKEAEVQVRSNSNNSNMIQKLEKEKNLPAYVYTEEGNLYYLDRWNSQDFLSKIPINGSQQKTIIELLGNDVSANNKLGKPKYIQNTQAIKLLNHDSYTVAGSRKEALKTLAFMLNFELEYLGIMYEKDKDKAITHFDNYYYSLFKIIPRKTLEESVLSQLSDTKQQLFFTLIKHREDVMNRLSESYSSSGPREPSPSKPSLISTFLSFFSISSNDLNESHTTNNGLKEGDDNSIVDYYKNAKTDSECGRKSFMNFSMSTFDNNWVAYTKSNLGGVDINKPDWKINLSIHQDDIVKALPIIAKIALDNDLGSFKVMTKKYAEQCQNKKTMKGREFVIFNSANPDFDAQKFIQILSKIEESLKKAQVRNSTDNPPRSNRKLGYYSSYTHDAWTNEGGRMNQ